MLLKNVGGSLKQKLENGIQTNARDTNVSTTHNVNRPFHFEQLTVLNFDGSPTLCSTNKGW